MTRWSVCGRASGTGDAVVIARAAADTARTSGARDPYKKQVVAKTTEEHAKAMHAYDVARKKVERAAL